MVPKPVFEYILVDPPGDDDLTQLLWHDQPGRWHVPQLFQGQTVVIEGSAVVGVRSLSPYISNIHQPNHFLYFWDPVCVKGQKFYHNDVTNINCLHDHWNTFIRLHYFLVIVECHNPTRRRWTFILYIMHFVSLYLNWLWVSGWSRGNNIKTKQQGITLDVLNSCLNFSTSSVFTSARLFSSNHSFAHLATIFTSCLVTKLRQTLPYSFV